MVAIAEVINYDIGIDFSTIKKKIESTTLRITIIDY